MVVVSTRDFRTNQTKYLNLAKAGEHVVLKSRAGSFRILPDEGSDTIDAPRDLMKELRNALNKTTRIFLKALRTILCKAMRLQKTYAKSVWLSKQKAKVNLVVQG